MAFKNRKKNYPLYETTMFDNLRTMTENVANRFPDKYAITYKIKPTSQDVLHYTYEEGRVFIRSIATEFISMGMRDSNVALIGEASPEWVFSYFALMSIGAVTVPIDKELPADDMASILNTAACPFVVYSSAIAEKIKTVKELVPSLNTFVEMGSGCEEFATNLDTVRELGAKKYADGDNSYYDYEIDPKRLASIVFTSGTTGKGKGVMLTTENICMEDRKSVV